jgi:hypothetical protein
LKFNLLGVGGKLEYDLYVLMPIGLLLLIIILLPLLFICFGVSDKVNSVYLGIFKLLNLRS